MIQVIVTIAVLGLTMLMGLGMITATCMFIGRPTPEHLEKEETMIVPHAPTVQFIEK